MILHYGDLTDSTCLVHIISQVRPTEIFNLAAQSHVKVSFDMAEYTGQVDALGTLRILDAIRTCGLTKSVKFYQVRVADKLHSSILNYLPPPLLISQRLLRVNCTGRCRRCRKVKQRPFTPGLPTVNLNNLQSLNIPRCCQIVCLLDRGELSRGVRDVCV